MSEKLINGWETIPANERKTILLLSDDLRLHSGIATMSRHIVLGLLHRYNVVQIGAGINHPDVGKILDISEDTRKLTGIEDASLKIIPWNGYGDANILRQVMEMYNPSAILHFTDPRYFSWLYHIEHEIRQKCPLVYYTIWDDLPLPLWNRDFYESCDYLACISKQTYGIITNIGKIESNTRSPFEDWQVDYVPHGIDSNVFKPINVDTIPAEFKKVILGDKAYDFVLFWSNRNIRRKQPADVIVAYSEFCKSLPNNEGKNCLLLMHTAVRDENGTDLMAVKNAMCSEYDVRFSESKLTQEQLNWLYNLSDVTINIAGNEGFGLTTAESVMAGTPIIVNVTGGLQDQCGFKLIDSDEYLNHKDYVSIGSLHRKDLWKDKVQWGEWVYPVWSSAHNLTGSIPTPYIWDDKVNLLEVTEAIKYWYDIKSSERKRRAMLGRKWMINDANLEVSNMVDGIIRGFERTFENWKPRQRWATYKIT
jgi:glycosyltransferase involved in cell wall biosynthesis